MQTNIDLVTKTNEAYHSLYANNDRYLVLMGGGGSGKSYFAACKLVYRLLSEKGHRILVCRKVAKTLRESCFVLLQQIISDWDVSALFSINKTDMSITCKNGSTVIMAGLDDVEKLKSIICTSIWIEEASELDIEDYRQLD